MKQIDNYFFEDDFTFTEDTFHGVHLFVDGKHIYQDKSSMLYANAIGRACESCGAFVDVRHYTVCDCCREKKANEEYLKCEIVPQTKYLYSDLLDKFFEKDEWDYIYNYLEDQMTYDEIMNTKFEDFCIHPCYDYFARQIDIVDYFEDAPEEFDLESYTPILEIKNHIDEVNKLLYKHPVGYQPDMKKRVTISDEAWREIKKDVISELRNTI